MNIRWLQYLKSPQVLWQALILALAAIPLLGMGLWVYNKHQWGLQQLETLEPRYARLLGMRQQQDEIEKTLQTVQAKRGQYIYSGTEASAQIGAAVQQKLRSVMGVAGLSVTSSQVQVKPAEDESSPYEKVVISMTAEGEMSSFHTALQGMYEVRPAISIDELSINRNGNLYTAGPQKAPMLNVQFMVSILKNKGN